MFTHPPYRLPRYMLFDLPRDVIRIVARFRLRVHALRIETTTWNSTSSPTCVLCEADDNVQDEKHVLFYTPSDDFSLQEIQVLTYTDRGCVCTYSIPGYYFTPEKQQTPPFRS